MPEIIVFVETSSRVLMGFLFWPRGGSAQVVRYLAPALGEAGWPVRLVPGSLGGPGEPGYAADFYDQAAPGEGGIDLWPVDYTPAVRAWEQTGADPLDQPVPLHPSYEDRPGAPDRIFTALDDAAYRRQVDAWSAAFRRALADWPGGAPRLAHLHHLTPMQTAIRQVAPGLPVVVQLHGTELLLLEALARPLPDTPAWTHAAAWRDRFVGWAQDADLLLVASPRDQERVAASCGIPAGRVALCPHGVDVARFAPRRLRGDERLTLLRRWLVEQPCGWDESGTPGSVRYSEADLASFTEPGQPVLLFVGRFTEPKRLPLLLRAYGRARVEHGLRAPLVVWGGYPGEWEGEHPATLTRREGIDGVFFTGWHGHDELPLGLACADVFVSPSVGEAFGQVFLEAMAAGLPVIAARSGGPVSFVDPDPAAGNGWLVEPDDEDSLVAALVEAASDAKGRRSRAKAGRELVCSRYSWDAAAQRIVRQYEAVS